ncbi:unnamed protein product [Lepeophtheirus salmonis]|uniref:(salmon louse) hypothetical protein n=1 Tax=Lepeophtheirus salmonis TaxID=72036 RepID=A0A7R8CZZ4_LEPSM|nr:unnamed protein product [Lepeophtheirus salmonis]CAF2978856.1 unnamed protein product [Lepeophtheirus salmonis]
MISTIWSTILSLEKTWSENSKRDIYDPLDDDELPTGFESDNENENDWMKELVNHMSLVHEFDFESVRKDSKTLVLSTIPIQRRVNASYGRKRPLQNSLTTKDEWDQSQYFFPTYENDNFLSCLEENEESTEGNGEIPPVIGEDCPVKESILSEEDFRESLLPKSRRKKQEA